MRLIFFLIFFSSILFAQNYYVKQNEYASTFSFYYTGDKSDVNSLGIAYYYTLGGKTDVGVQIKKMLRETKLITYNILFQTSVFTIADEQRSFDLGFGIGLLYESDESSNELYSYNLETFFTHIPYFISFTQSIGSLTIQPRFIFDSYVGNSRVELKYGTSFSETISGGGGYTTVRFGIGILLKQNNFQLNIVPEVFLDNTINVFQIGLGMTI